MHLSSNNEENGRQYRDGAPYLDERQIEYERDQIILMVDTVIRISRVEVW